MPRIPYPDRGKAVPAVQANGAKTINVERMTYYLPDHLREAMAAYNSGLVFHGTLNPKLREIALVRVGHLSNCPYELFHHEALARRVGVPEEKIAALGRPETSTAFSAEERAVVEFTDEIVRSVRPGDKALAEVQKHLTNAEVMELIFVVGHYMTLCRVLETFGPEMDSDALEPVGR